MKEFKRRLRITFSYVTEPSRIWYEMMSYVEMVKRMVFWGWKMRWSWDFDANTIYEILHLKYNRIYKCMEKHHHLEWNKNIETKGMKKLRTMVLLTKRISDDKYVDIADPTYWDEFWAEKERNNIKDFFDRDEKDRERFVNAIKKSEEIKKQDKEMFLKLLKEDNDGWWD